MIFSLAAEFKATRLEGYQPPRMDSIEPAWQDFDRRSAAWSEGVRSSDSEYLLDSAHSRQVSSAHCLRSLSLRQMCSIPQATRLCGTRRNEWS